MIYVYIILGIIIILFITVVMLAIRKYNNEVVTKELEYVSENYNVDEINDHGKIASSESNITTNQAAQVESTPVENKAVAEQQSVVTSVKPALQEPVDNTPPPVIELKIPEQTDEEISIEDTAIKEDSILESIEIKDNALKEVEEGDEFNIVDNSLKVEESGESAVVIPDSTPTPAPQVVEVPKDTTNYTDQAFNNKFDGNTTINRDIKVESPVPKDLNKTEIWDMSEVRSVLNSNEKN